MKLIILSLAMLVSTLGMKNKQTSSTPAENAPVKSPQAFYTFKVKSLDGETIDFSKYKGKKVMVVNVASKCGFTPQYGELEELHEKYGDKVVILGFPANNFGGQEPGSNGEIAEFCKKNYGVKFQMFEKISVTGDDQHPLYQWLSKKELNGWNDQAPKWNFTKYLINEKGELVKHFPSAIKPLSKEVIDAINS
jgi:glutathione peroxidase